MSKFILSGFADELNVDLSQQIEEFKRLGISYIEIRGIEGKKNITSYTIDEVKEFKKLLDKNNMKISSIGSPIGKIKINEPFEPHFELFKHTVEIAKTLDTKYIRIFSFFMPEITDNADNFKDEVLNKLKIFIEYAKSQNVVLLHENEKHIYGDTVKRVKILMENLYCDHFKMTFDPANFVQCNEETYPYAYNTLKQYFEYMHIKDANSAHTCVPAGTGSGKIPEILKELKASGYEGFLSLEPHLGKFAGLMSLELETEDLEKLQEAGIHTYKIAVDALRGIINSL